MGLMDKVKAQATQLAEKAQEAATVGQAKLGNLQTKKQADALLRELGAHQFAKAKGRGDASTDSKIAGVMAQLDAHEAQHGPVDLTPDPLVDSTTQASGGVAPPASTVPSGSPVHVASVDANQAPVYTPDIPSGGVGSIPSGNVGGVPSGSVGGVPAGETGNVPRPSVGDTPS